MRRAASVPIERFEDWFDGVIVLTDDASGTDMTALSTALSARLPNTSAPWTSDGVRGAIAALRSKRPLVLGDGRRAAPDLGERPYLVAIGGEGVGFDLAVARTPSVGDLEGKVCSAIRRSLKQPKKLNILVLYCDVFTNIETIYEHLNSFSLFSKHNVFFFPVSDTGHMRMFEGYEERWPESWDLGVYDVIIWHYVVPAYLKERLSPLVADRLSAYDGLKVLFVQDEYDSTSTTTEWINRVGIDVMFTCVPPEGLDHAYPPDTHPGVEFFQTLTGYVPEDRGLERFITPMAERSLRIAYRGRALPFRYGRLARAKYVIGVEMKRLADERGVSADIAVDEESRIYGLDWYRFLGSARATLATESGSNVFDFDGSLKALSLAAEEEGISFEDFHAKHLANVDGLVRMNQVSPKIFEAIRLRTALVCFEGEYSGVIKPHLHYIPLKTDFSNVEAVFAKLEDVEALEAMTARAYDDVIRSGRYDYAAFIREFDAIVDARVIRPPRAEIISAPLLVSRRGETDRRAVVRPSPYEYMLNTGVLRNDLKRRDLEEMMAGVREAEIAPCRTQGSAPPADACIVQCYGPEAVVCYDFWCEAGAAINLAPDGILVTTPPQAWHYAAGVNLNLSRIDFAEEHAWARVVLRNVAGEFRTSLYEAEGDRLHEEKVASGAREAVFYLKVAGPSLSLLLFRTGQHDMPASAVFIGAEVLTAPAYPKAVLDTARHLSDLPPGRFPWWG